MVILIINEGMRWYGIGPQNYSTKLFGTKVQSFYAQEPVLEGVHGYDTNIK